MVKIEYQAIVIEFNDIFTDLALFNPSDIALLPGFWRVKFTNRGEHGASSYREG
jgi:hypothetical protein